MEFKNLELFVQEGLSLEEIDEMRNILDGLPLTVKSLWSPRNEGMVCGITLRKGGDEIVLQTDPDNKVLYEGIEKLSSSGYVVSVQIQTSEYVAQGPYFEIFIKDKQGNVIELR